MVFDYSKYRDCHVDRDQFNHLSTGNNKHNKTLGRLAFYCDDLPNTEFILILKMEIRKTTDELKTMDPNNIIIMNIIMN